MDQDPHKGLGLGLAIVERLAKLLDHEIRLRSIPGKGSVFSVAIPRGREEDVIANTAVEHTTAFDLTGVLILVIDSEPAVRQAMEALLGKWNGEVITAASGAEMKDKLPLVRRVPSLIISDYRPRAPATLGAGPTLAAIDMLRDEFNTEIPAVLLTGDTGIERSTRDQEVAGLPVLHKPLNPARLRTLIANLLRIDEQRKDTAGELVHWRGYRLIGAALAARSPGSFPPARFDQRGIRRAEPGLFRRQARLGCAAPSGRLARDHADSAGDEHGLRPVHDTQHLEDGRDVSLHRLLGQAQLGGDLFVGLALADARQHFELAQREQGDVRLWPTANRRVAPGSACETGGPDDCKATGTVTLPSSTCCRTSISTRVAADFGTKPMAPALMAWRTFSGSSRADSTTTGSDGSRSCSFPMRLNPLIPGSARSSNTRSRSGLSAAVGQALLRIARGHDGDVVREGFQCCCDTLLHERVIVDDKYFQGHFSGEFSQSVCGPWSVAPSGPWSHS